MRALLLRALPLPPAQQQVVRLKRVGQACRVGDDLYLDSTNLPTLRSIYLAAARAGLASRIHISIPPQSVHNIVVRSPATNN